MTFEDGTESLAPLLRTVRDPEAAGRWRKCVFSKPAALVPWIRVGAEPVLLSGGAAVRLTYHTGKEQRVATVAMAAWPAALDDLLAASPRHIELLTAEGDWHARRGKRRWLVGRGGASASAVSSDAIARHDRTPRHPLDPADPEVQRLFVATGLFGRTGQLRGESASKYRQVQHYLDLLRPLAVLRPGGRRKIRIIDAGCGSAHLSLALYLFARRQGFDASLTGVDTNDALVAGIMKTAELLGYEGATFRVLPVMDLLTEDRGGGIDLLVSLHLCDTGTDDALLAGVRLRARAIVLVPCCQHEINSQLSAGVADEADAALIEYGTMRERFAALLTDELRALALRASGYQVDVVELGSPADTGKNVMLRAELRGRGGPEDRREAARRRFDSLCSRWGVRPSCARVLEPREG